MVVRAKHIMTDRVITVRPGCTLQRAWECLIEHRFSSLPVVDERSRLVGMLSGADLLRTGLRGHLGGHPRTVGGLMRTNPMYVSPDTDVGIIAHRLNAYGHLRVMPIVDHGLLVGVITRADLLRPRPRGGRLGRFFGRLLKPSRRAGPTNPMRWPAPAGSNAAQPRAQDVMTPTGHVYTVTENTPAAAAAMLLISNRFTALPVVDDQGRLVGLVSEADLINDPLDGHRTTATTVGGKMSTEIVTVSPDTPLDELAWLLSDGDLRLVPVVNHEQLLGVVSRGDVLRATGV